MKRTPLLKPLAALFGIAMTASAQADFISPVDATASSNWTTRVAANTVNGVGIISGSGTAGIHGKDTNTMWHPDGAYIGEKITFDLGETYTSLEKIYIWNYNENHSVNNNNGRAVKDFTVEVSPDGVSWSAPTAGASQTCVAIAGGYAASIPLTNTLYISASNTRYVRFTLVSSFGQTQYVGFSEVAFEGSLGPDETAPELASTDPADLSAGAYPGTNLVATFDEDIALTGAGTITITDTDDGSGNQLIALPNAGVTVSGADLIIDPAINLEFLTNYEIVIDGLAIVDQADIPNPFAGTASGDWTFQTVAVDASAPLATVYNPADNAIDVLPDAILTLTFDEDIVLNSGATTVLLDEDFEGDDGGFAHSGDWAWGTPNSNNNDGLVLTTGNSGVNCWGTNLGTGGTPPSGVITADTDSILLSPNTAGNGIDLTGVAAAELQFAAAVDAIGDDTLEVLVKQVGTGTTLVTIPATALTPAVTADWATYGPYDISDAAGDEVYLEFRFKGTNAQYIGLYIDDVRVTGTDAANAITLKNLTGGTDTVIAVDDSSQVSVSGATLTITPAGPLAAAANYAVQIGSTAVRNYNDLNFAGIADTTTWNFSTAATTTYGGNGSTNADRWNDPANWDIAVPSGGLSAVIPSSNPYVTVWSNDTQTYTGDLTMDPNTTVQVGWTNNYPNSWNFLGTAGSTTITMGDGALIKGRTSGSPSVPAIVLQGDVTFSCGESTQTPASPTFGQPITGAHTFTVQSNASGPTVTMGATNTFSNFVIKAIGGRGGSHGTVKATAAGSLGTGDVTLVPVGDLALKLEFDVANAMSSTGTLNVNGRGPSGNGANRVQMDTNNTIGALNVEGFPFPAGTYGRIGTPADPSVDYEVDWIAGDSVLTVNTDPGDLVDPTAVTMTDNSVNGEVFLSLQPTITYTLSFNEPVTTTVTAADFEVSGTAPASIDSATQVSATEVEVVVTASGTGTMTLAAKASASFDDLFGNTLSGPFSDPAGVTVRDIAELSTQLGILELTANNAVNPATGNLWQVGDTYRYIFTTSTLTAATSTDIATYNTFVQNAANASSLNIGAAQGATWKALGSTLTVNARDNTATNIAVNGTGESIYLLDGTTLMATDYAALWGSSSRLTAVNKTEELTTPPNVKTYGDTWAGIYRHAYPDANYGTASANDELGAVDGSTTCGLWQVGAGTTGTQWIWRWTNTTTTELPMYALSDPLTVSAVGSGPPYASWSGGFGGLTDTDAALDFDKGGLATGIEWVVGGDPTNGSDDAGLAPGIDTTSSPGNALFVFRRTAEAGADDNTVITVEYGYTLDGDWTPADPGTDGSSIGVVVDGFGAGVDKVTVTFPTATFAPDGILFARLKAVVTAP